MKQTFQTVILAGGEGTRLKPLTDDIPKPMLPVCGTPVIERLYALLEKNGFESAAVAVRHMSDKVEASASKSLRLKFFREDKPLGSAGAVRAILPYLDDTVLIMCGDAVCDFDLKSLYEKHVRDSHRITVVLTRTSSPLEYGTVLIENGIIKRFIEKPSWADTLTNLISTGIYIVDKDLLEMLPEGKNADFANDFFPLVSKHGIPLHGEEAAGSWFDIGSPNDYYRCSMSLSGGETVVGNGCDISPDARVRASVLLDGVTVGASMVDGAILCEDVSVGDGCVIPKGCVIGSGTVIGDGAVLSPNLKLEGGLEIKKGTQVMRDYYFGEVTKRIFCEDGVCTRIDFGFGVKLGHALSVLGAPAKIGVMYAEGLEMQSESIILGAAEAGSKVIRFGKGFPALAAFSATEYECDCCVFVSERDNAFLFGREGIRLGTLKQRQVEKAMDMRLKSVDKPDITDENPLDPYSRWLQGQAETLSGSVISIGSSSQESEIFYSVALSLDASASYGEHGFFLPKDGMPYLRDEEGRTLSFWQLFLLASLCRKCVWVDRETPVAVERYLRSQGVTVRYYNDSDSPDRKSAFQTAFLHDPILLCLLAVKQLHEASLTPAQAKEKLPEVFVVTRDVDGDEQENAEKINLLSEACADVSRGVRIHYRGGSVAIYPSAKGGFRIFAEAVSSEIARELCDLTERRLK